MAPQLLLQQLLNAFPFINNGQSDIDLRQAQIIGTLSNA
ncbi:hypothetical protein N644_2681 [Lactiplantibacillus paraplantarum]|nr:hypothetical protein N644_2681 [Lactiplantibacillus paraplantarum]